MSAQAEQPELPAGSGRQPTFQERAAGTFGPVIVEACEAIPELRSVAVVFDWADDLNEVALPFLWGDANRAIKGNNVPAILGMLQQTRRFWMTQIEQLDATVAAYQAILEKPEPHAEAQTTPAKRQRPSVPVPGQEGELPEAFRRLRHPAQAFASSPGDEAVPRPNAP